MAVERLSLSPVVLQAVGEEDPSKAPRLPRWTRQELLVLIQGKRVAENRVRRGRTAVLAFGSSQVEPKWSSVSSYCKRHGVNRGPVQCRKRWSNLAGDFKKIKEWESQIKEEAESFWVMRNDLRRERKLPGFFDREVYDILDGAPPPPPPAADSLVLSLAPTASASASAAEDDKDKDKDVVFDSGRTAAADDALFSDKEEQEQEEEKDKEAPPAPTPTPVSASQYAYEAGVPPPAADKQGPEERERKRKRPKEEEEEEVEEEEEEEIQKQLIEAMERNGRLLSSQLEIQNTNSQLDREQRRDHANSLFAVLNKLADAMVKIADKL